MLFLCGQGNYGHLSKLVTISSKSLPWAMYLPLRETVGQMRCSFRNHVSNKLCNLIMRIQLIFISSTLMLRVWLLQYNILVETCPHEESNSQTISRWIFILDILSSFWKISIHMTTFPFNMAVTNLMNVLYVN